MTKELYKRAPILKSTYPQPTNCEAKIIDSSVEIFPGMDLQNEIDFAVVEGVETVKLMEGNFPLESPLVLDERHSGLKIIGNPENPKSVVLDGQDRTQIIIVDGISTAKSVEFSISGVTIANGNTTPHALSRNFDNQEWSNPRTWGRYTSYANFDGAGVLVLGKAHGEVDSCIIRSCRARYCGAGISLQQYFGKDSAKSGQYLLPVTISNTQFIKNRAKDTGVDIDLLPVSYAVIKNCIFSGSVANQGKRDKNHGLITIFPDSIAEIEGNIFNLSDNQSTAIDYQKGHGAVKIVGNTINCRRQDSLSVILDLTGRRPQISAYILDQFLHTDALEGIKSTIANFPNVIPRIYSLSSDTEVGEAHKKIADSLVEGLDKYFVER